MHFDTSDVLIDFFDLANYYTGLNCTYDAVFIHI